MNQKQIRKFMEMAVDVMRRSIPEPRADGKASPKVGAVLVMPGGKVDTAYRGELRHGDHAEFTLLERKNRDQNLDGSTLFATLEPCAPQARRFPKLGCAERIVLARITQVFIGIEDPDPTVDRKGIKYLQDSGIQVHMFERDLQEAIRKENKDFIAQALERAAAVEEKPREITLSPLEKAGDRSEFDDLSEPALEEFRSAAHLADEVPSAEFRRRLTVMGIVKQDGARFLPTGFGLLLFGKEPRAAMPQAGLLATIHYPDGKEELGNFEGPQVLVPSQVLRWLRDKLPNLIDRTEARRRGADEPLFEIVREGIVNALVHRDYGIAGAKCQLSVTPDTIEVRSPGRPVEPITTEQLQSFNAPMLSRNPTLHYVFGRMELAEERGLGLRSMKRRAEAAGLPLPRYMWNDPYLVLTVYRRPESVTRTLPADVLAALNDDERAALELAARTRGLSSPKMAQLLGFDERKARRILNKLVQLKLVRRFGKGPTTRYQVL